MLALIIVSKKQVQYLSLLIEKIKEFKTLPDEIYYMMDRDNNDDIDTARRLIAESNIPNMHLCINSDIPNNMGRPLMVNGEEQFLAGYCRNLCIDKAIKAGCDQFVFIDGDCMPEGEIVSGYKKYLDSDKPIALCGKRNDFQFGFRDQREFNKYANMFEKDVTEIIDYAQVLDSAVLWTCNFGMNLKAINRIKAINKCVYGFDEVFSSFFLGTWGGEDGFLGVECFLDTEIVLAGFGMPRTGITHIHHERPESKYSHQNFMNQLSNMVKIHEYMISNYTVED